MPVAYRQQLESEVTPISQVITLYEPFAMLQCQSPHCF